LAGPPHIAQASEGALYVTQDGSSWTLVPDELSDSDLGALDMRGQVESANLTSVMQGSALFFKPIYAAAVYYFGVFAYTANQRYLMF
jgi:hypothetical protein